MHEYENEMHVMDVLFRIMYRKKEIMYRGYVRHKRIRRIYS